MTFVRMHKGTEEENRIYEEASKKMWDLYHAHQLANRYKTLNDEDLNKLWNNYQEAVKEEIEAYKPLGFTLNN